MNFEQLCMGCMTFKGEAEVCPECGYDEQEYRSPLVLPYRTLLNKQYLVGRVLGKPGGFGITYLGWDVQLQTRVAIKEYLPRDLAGRETGNITVAHHSREDKELFHYGLEQFLQEGRTLAKFDHANVVRVRAFFEENGTAYLVMDYYEGVTLAEYLAQKGGRLPEETTKAIIMPILDGLREIHSKGFLHRDIKPQNIYLTSEGRPILLDFGAARVAMGERSRSMSVVLTPGFAPFEQYHRRGEQGPWTDIYAAAATIYYMITGLTPPEAAERIANDELIPPVEVVPNISETMSTVLMQAMAIDPAERPQNVQAFQNMLLANEFTSGDPEIKTQADSGTGKAPSAFTSVPNTQTPVKKNLPRWVWGLGAAVLALFFLVLVGLLNGNNNSSLPVDGNSKNVAGSKDSGEQNNGSKVLVVPGIKNNGHNNTGDLKTENLTANALSEFGNYVMAKDYIDAEIKDLANRINDGGLHDESVYQDCQNLSSRVNGLYQELYGKAYPGELNVFKESLAELVQLESGRVNALVEGLAAAAGGSDHLPYFKQGEIYKSEFVQKNDSFTQSYEAFKQSF